MVCERIGCDESAMMVVDTNYETVAMCGGHFFDCSDGLPQSGKSVRFTSEGERIKMDIEQEEYERLLTLVNSLCTVKVSHVHVHLLPCHQRRIREEIEMEEILDDG